MHPGARPPADAVLLVERKKAESLMPGMWELPQIEADGVDGPWLKLRHSITVTDYTVRVRQGPAGISTKSLGKTSLFGSGSCIVPEFGFDSLFLS